MCVSVPSFFLSASSFLLGSSSFFTLSPQHSLFGSPASLSHIQTTWSMISLNFIIIFFLPSLVRGPGGVLSLGLLCVRPGGFCDFDQSDSQVEPLLLWPPALGHTVAGLAPGVATETSPHPPCFTAWDVLLHHNRYVVWSQRNRPGFFFPNTALALWGLLTAELRSQNSTLIRLGPKLCHYECFCQPFSFTVDLHFFGGLICRWPRLGFLIWLE